MSNFHDSKTGSSPFDECFDAINKRKEEMKKQRKEERKRVRNDEFSMDADFIKLPSVDDFVEWGKLETTEETPEEREICILERDIEILQDDINNLQTDYYECGDRQILKEAHNYFNILKKTKTNLKEIRYKNEQYTQPNIYDQSEDVLEDMSYFNR
jgi:hypothetical protein